MSICSTLVSQNVSSLCSSINRIALPSKYFFLRSSIVILQCNIGGGLV
ncbi:hypothetical protein LINPERPRIM_LOCUS7657, partial [Linum perenne]